MNKYTIHYDLSSIMSRSHQLRKHSKGLTLSQALKMSWKSEKSYVVEVGQDPNLFRDVLRNKVCKFVFTKVSGEERVMRGTLNNDFIPQESLPKTSLKYDEDKQVRLFDLDLQEWRSFKPENFLVLLQKENFS